MSACRAEGLMGNEPVSSAGTHFRQLTVLQTAQIREKRADAQAGALRTEYDDNFAKGYRIRPAPGHRPRGNPEATRADPAHSDRLTAGGESGAKMCVRWIGHSRRPGPERPARGGPSRT
jgi:hypothetical protein